MGPAHSSVINHTNQRLCVITFNNADILYKTYHTMYCISPGDTIVAEANPDPVGLKIGIVYQVEEKTNELFFFRFICKNDSILNITNVSNESIQFYGSRTDDIILGGKNRCVETERVPFQMASETVLPVSASSAPSIEINFEHEPHLTQELAGIIPSVHEETIKLIPKPRIRRKKDSK